MFQVAWVDEKMHWHDKRLRRAQVLEFFARLAPAKVVMESGARHVPLSGAGLERSPPSIS